MPTMRTTYSSTSAKKSKFSNFGSSKFAAKTTNTQYFAKSAEKNVFAFRNKSNGGKTQSLKSAAGRSTATQPKSRAKQKRPTMRGAMPTTSLWSLSDEGTVNARLDYNRGLAINATANRARYKTEANTTTFSAVNSRQRASFSSRSYAQSRAATSFLGTPGAATSFLGTPGAATSFLGTSRASSMQVTPGAPSMQKSNQGMIGLASSDQARAAKSYFQGNAALKLNNEAVPAAPQMPETAPEFEIPKTAKTKTKKQRVKKAKQAAKPIVTAIPGQIRSTGIFHSTKLSPLMLSVAKLSTALVLVVACMAFVRVGFNAATVTAGIESNQITQDIQNEINTRNELKVQDSTLANSSRIRQAANDYKLVAPVTTESITLSPDTLALDSNNEISLVGSLNRLSASQQ